MLFLKSLIFNIAFFSWSILIVLSTLPGLILHQRYVTRCAYYWGLGTHILLRKIIGVEYEVRGQEHWNGEPALFACKHESVLETTMIQVLAYNSSIILKRELTWIPFFGQAVLKAGVIPINRSKGKKVFAQILEGARRYTAQGRSLFVFPEGTRKPVNAPTELRVGIAVLYEDLNLPVFPVALNTGLVWGRRQFLKKPGKVIYEILPPIMPGLSKEEFLEKLTQTIENKTQELRLESKAWQDAQRSTPALTTRKYGLYALGGLLLLALAGYTAAWHQAAQKLEDHFKMFEKTCAEKGGTFTHDPLSVSGFPLHMRANLSQASIINPAWGKTVFDKGMIIETSIFSFDKVTVHAPSLTLTSTRVPFTLTSAHMGGEIFFIFDPTQKNPVSTSKIDIGLEDVRIKDLFKSDVTVQQVNLELINPTHESSGNFYLQTTTVKNSLLPIPEIEEITFSFDTSSLSNEKKDHFTWDQFQNWQDKDGPLSGYLRVKALPLKASLEGTIALSKEQEIEGAASLFIEGLDPFLDQLVQTKHLNFLAAQGYKLAFSMASAFAKSRGVKGREDGQVPLALSLQKGVVFLGELPMGDLPVLTWPKAPPMIDQKTVIQK